MTEFLLSQDMFPFTLSLALVFGLLLLEVIFLLFGWSLLSADSDGIDTELTDIDIGVDGVELDAPDVDIDAEISGSDAPGLEIPPPTLSSWLGLGKVPIAIWIATLLTGFGLSGFVLQSILNGIFGFTMPAMMAIPLAVVPALAFVRICTQALSRIIPKTETTAISRRSMGSQHGVISQGTARRGKPAEVRLKDRHGNTHYLRAEPFEDTAVLPQGTEVYVLRRRDGTFRAMEITLD